MPIVNIEGLRIDFPFEPYKCQSDYMRAVARALQSGDNALLESPTGTGKTLCLLTSTLAWRDRMKNSKFTSSTGQNVKDTSWSVQPNALESQSLTVHTRTTADGWDKYLRNGVDGLSSRIPKIIYTSRTHSQLTQVINELKNTAYTPVISILASREQLCIHPQVSRAENNAQRTHQCGALVSSRSCSFFNKVEAMMTNNEVPKEPMDIEDLVKFGQAKSVCPYYINKQMYDSAEITFMPYNYVIDSKIRNHLKINLENTVVIIDEGHNINNVCESTASFDLTAADVAGCIEELKEAIGMAKNIPADELKKTFAITPDNLGVVLEFCMNLEEQLHSEMSRLKAAKIEDGMGIFTRFKDAGMDPAADPYFGTFIAYAQCAYDILQRETTIGPDGEPVITMSRKMKGVKLKHLGEILRALLHPSNATRGTFAINYKTILQPSMDMGHQTKRTSAAKKKQTSWGDAVVAPTAQQTAPTQLKGWGLSYWCFSPRYAMNDLKRNGVRNVIITSGTLSPMREFASEMALSFGVQLTNSHVITSKQVWVGVMEKGPNRQALNSSFRNRTNEAYITDLGMAIVRISASVPDGVLVFFPSYATMTAFIEQWKKPTRDGGGKTLWERINANKPAVVEPKGKTDFQIAINQYYASIKEETGTGASFFAVTRGKVSEGLDFADANGRAVIITGLPFPALMDVRVATKRQFMDDIQKIHKEMPTGNTWYTQEAMRAVNQAIGRVIRHRNDFGAIIFCDERFAWDRTRQDISAWVRPAIQCFSDFDKAQVSLQNFFKKITADNARGVGVGGAVTRQKYPKVQKLELVPSQSDAAVVSMTANVFTRKRTSTRSGIIEYDFKKTPRSNEGADDEYNTNGGRDFFSPPKPKPVVTFGQLQPKALGIEAATEGTQKPKVNPKSRPLKRKTPNSLFGASNSSETFAGIEAVEANKVPSEAELQGSKPYMTEVKRIKKDQYKNFMLLLLNAKRGKVSAHQLLDQVNQMFGDTPHLLRAFRQFLPPKDLPLWDQRMSTAL